MRLPKSFTTVTPLSKILAMILFITLPFGGFYAGYKYNENLNRNTSEVRQIQVDSSENIIDSQITYKIPAGWNKNFYNGAVELTSSDYRYNSPEGNDRGQKIIIVTLPMPSGQTLKQVLDSWTGINYEEIIVDNISGFNFDTSTEYSPSSIRYAIAKDNTIWDFSIQNSSQTISKAQASEIFTDFISSVSFKRK